MVFEFDRSDRSKFPCAECMFQQVAQNKTPECLETITENDTQFYPGMGKMATSHGTQVRIKGTCKYVEELLDESIVDHDSSHKKMISTIKEIDSFSTEAGGELWESIYSLDPPTIEEYNVLKKLVSKVMKKSENTALFTLYLSCFSESELKSLSCDGANKLSSSGVNKRLINVCNGVGKKLLQDSQKPSTLKNSDIERLNAKVALKRVATRIEKAKKVEKDRRRWRMYFLELANGTHVPVLRHYAGLKQLRYLNKLKVCLDGRIIYQSTIKKQLSWTVVNGFITECCTLDKKQNKSTCKSAKKSGSKLSKDLSAAEFKRRWLSQFIEDEV